MATIRLEYDYAKAKANVMEDNANKIEKILNNLVDDMQKNINDSTWSGNAADNFKRVWNQSAEKFSSFVQYMKSIQSKVQTASEEARFYDKSNN